MENNKNSNKNLLNGNTSNSTITECNGIRKKKNKRNELRDCMYTSIHT